MCGILGIITPETIREEEFSQALFLLRHRGPDEYGVVGIDNCLLGCQRLKIIDLESGRQPLTNEDNSLWIVFNGEIYNYKQLREKLVSKGHIFRTKSDTEVIVHLYEEEKENCLKYLQGMFAFAIYDQKEKICFLARDRFGIKPLFYYQKQEKLIFASEIKPILKLLNKKPDISNKGLNFYFWLDYIPSPYTIYENLFSLLPAHYLKFSKNKLQIKQYYKLSGLEIKKASLKFVSQQLKNRLEKSIQEHLVSDVELGLFLSGGLDSSILTLIMRKKLKYPFKTFTIGFTQSSYDESFYASLVSKKFSVNNIPQKLNSENLLQLFLEVIPKLEQPFADHSILPTYFLSQLSARYVKAVLSGDGGDEIFLGYQTYIAHKIHNLLKYLPENLKIKFLNSLLLLIPPCDRYFSLNFCLQRFLRSQSKNDIQRHINWMATFAQQRRNLVQCYENVELEYLDLIKRKFLSNFQTPFSKIQAFDLYTYLSNDILYKTDFSTMQNSLEARVPYLEPELVEFSIGLPAEFKLRGIKTTKYILRKIYKDKLPAEIWRRKKMGFSLPTANLLRKEFKGYFADFVNRVPNFLNKGYIEKLFREHLNYQRDNRKLLWNLLVFFFWYENNQR